MTMHFPDSMPTADCLLDNLRRDEQKLKVHPVHVGELQLDESGALQFNGHTHRMSDHARRDLARLARIPVNYFDDLEPELQALNFQGRMRRVPVDQCLTVTVADDLVSRVQQGRLVDVGRSRIVESILEETPSDIDRNDIRAITYSLNGEVDVSFVAPTRTAEPREGDVTLGGVHLMIDCAGAVQVGPSLFRLVCHNGAVARACFGERHHRVRRGSGRNADRKLRGAVRRFAQESWASWVHVRAGLNQLADERICSSDVDQLIRRLRQRPFFISKNVAERVRDILTDEAPKDERSLYDFHNAITAVGTHHSDVLARYRYRLRLGAGSLARGRIGLCRECGQFVIR